MVTEVWSHNLILEIVRFSNLLAFHPYVAVDAEFPEFVSQGFAYTDADRYEDVKANVRSMKMIQLGLTLCSEDGSSHHSWQFNLCDFYSTVVRKRRSGIDLERNMREGVDSRILANMLKNVFNQVYGTRPITWITFHGIYDIAYLLKFFTYNEFEIPDTLPTFANIAGNILGKVYDLKYMAKYCEGLDGGRLGLVRLGEQMKVESSGECSLHHQAGHDSLLTGKIFKEMRKRYDLDLRRFEGVLYGFETVRLLRRSTMVALPGLVIVPQPTTPMMTMTVPAMPIDPVADRSCFEMIAVGPRRRRR